jgi:PAS domain S-box-containing protein
MEQPDTRLIPTSRPSLGRRLSLLTSALIGVVLSSFLWLAFHDVKDALLRAGADRAQDAAGQVAELLSESAERRLHDLQRLARHPAVREYLYDPNEDDAEFAARVHLTTATLADQPPVGIADARGKHLIAGRVASSPSGTKAPPLPKIAAPVPGISPFQLSNGVIYWDVVAEVRASSAASAPLVGYVTSRHLLSNAASWIDLSRLVQGAAITIGNQHGDVRTDLTEVTPSPGVEPPRAWLSPSPSDNDQGRIGATAQIAGTPWQVWVELPRKEVVEPASVFVWRMLPFGLVFVVTAGLFVYVFSPRITKPLRDLTAAAEAISAGSHPSRITTPRRDDIGRLAIAFNEMAERLEDRVQQRTLRLAEAEERTKAILSTANDAFVGMDGAGRIIDWNRQAETIFGWTSREAMGRGLVDTIIPERHRAAHRAGLARYLRTGDGAVLNQRMELTALRKNGDEFPVEITIWASGSTEDPTYHSFVRDITERKRAERAVSDAKTEAERANQAKNEFLSRMSHDLRTPLNAILGFAQLLETERLKPDQHEGVQLILRGGKHLLDLINEVLDITRIETGQLSLSPQPVDVRDVVQHAVALVSPLAADRGIALDIAELPKRWAVVADRQRLTQVLLNLLSNAIKYNRRRGRVTVAFEKKAGRRLRITVTDTGAGIPPDKLKRLFTPFERLGAEATAIEGTGLGLALSRGLTAAMGGSLGVVSRVDHGSTFWLEFTLADRPCIVPIDDTRPPQATDACITGKVLYIEDNLANVRLMERILERRPHVVLAHASTAGRGIRKAAEMEADLILLDLHLPDVNGEEVMRQLAQDPSLRSIPVVVLTADATPEQARRLIAAGATAYLTKPIEVARLLRLLDELLSQPPDDLQDVRAG